MTGKYYFKIHAAPSEVLISACDDDILGQTFSSGKVKITVSEGFYGGQLVDEVFLENNLKTYTILNLVGNRVVDFAIAHDLVDADTVMDIGGVKHVQAVKL